MMRQCRYTGDFAVQTEALIGRPLFTACSAMSCVCIGLNSSTFICVRGFLEKNLGCPGNDGTKLMSRKTISYVTVTINSKEIFS